MEETLRSGSLYKANHFEERLDFLVKMPLAYSFFGKDSKEYKNLLEIADCARKNISRTKDEINELANVVLKYFIPGQDGHHAITELVGYAKESALLEVAALLEDQVKGQTMETQVQSIQKQEILEKARQDGMDCATSLHQAMQEAGGRISDEYLDMTVRDFVSKVAAQNHIHFVYKGSRR